MRIGEFSQKFEISIDAVRFYIENGLLLPEKIHNQYDFDQQCVEDMKKIVELKKMKFTITEIKMLFSLIRLTHLVDKMDIAYYESLFVKKQELLSEEKLQLEEALDLLNADLQRLKVHKSVRSRPYGIPLSFFQVLTCPKCTELLTLDKATVEESTIFQGEVNCSCGYQAKIVDGLLITPSANLEMSEYLKHENPIRAYMDTTHPSFISFTKKGFDWIGKRIESNITAPQMFLEIGTGFGFFLGGFIEKLSDRVTYILTDNQIPLLKFTKNHFEVNFPNKKLVFIASDLNELPLRKECVHLILDAFGSTSHSFFHNFFPVQNIHPLLRKEGQWLGCYMYFDPQEAELKGDFRKYKPMFDFERLKSAYANFDKIDSARLAEIEVTPDLYDRFTEHSIVSLWVYKGKKR